MAARIIARDFVGGVGDNARLIKAMSLAGVVAFTAEVAYVLQTDAPVPVDTALTDSANKSRPRLKMPDPAYGLHPDATMTEDRFAGASSFLVASDTPTLKQGAALSHRRTAHTSERPKHARPSEQPLESKVGTDGRANPDADTVSANLQAAETQGSMPPQPPLTAPSAQTSPSTVDELPSDASSNEVVTTSSSQFELEVSKSLPANLPSTVDAQAGLPGTVAAPKAEGSQRASLGRTPQKMPVQAQITVPEEKSKEAPVRTAEVGAEYVSQPSCGGACVPPEFNTAPRPVAQSALQELSRQAARVAPSVDGKRVQVAETGYNSDLRNRIPTPAF